MSEPSIVLENVSKSFDGRIVIDSISSIFTKNEVHVILGKSGTGKSVLLKMLIGLIEPDSGSIKINGQDLDPHKTAKDYKKDFLGKIPINIDLRVAADSGKPLVEMNPDHKISKIFKEMATKVKESFL